MKKKSHIAGMKRVFMVLICMYLTTNIFCQVTDYTEFLSFQLRLNSWMPDSIKQVGYRRSTGWKDTVSATHFFNKNGRLIKYIEYHVNYNSYADVLSHTYDSVQFEYGSSFAIADHNKKSTYQNETPYTVYLGLNSDKKLRHARRFDNAVFTFNEDSQVVIESCQQMLYLKYERKRIKRRERFDMSDTTLELIEKYSYTPNGQLKKVQLFNSYGKYSVTKYAYYKNGQVERKTINCNQIECESTSKSYSYNLNGLLTKCVIRSINDGEIKYTDEYSYTFDALKRVIGIKTCTLYKDSKTISNLYFEYY